MAAVGRRAVAFACPALETAALRAGVDCAVCDPLIPPFENQPCAFFLDHGVALTMAARDYHVRKDVNLVPPRRIVSSHIRLIRS